LQEDKPPVFEALDMTVDCLLVLEGTLTGMEVQAETCEEAVSDPLLLATDLVDYLVLKGIPFRDAHHVVGALVALSEKSVCPLDAIPLDEAQKICDKIEADWTECFSVKKALASRERPGMPGPKQIQSELDRWKALLPE
jgi:argininosuccinate lyase